ncbi:hypothetical protein TCAL_14472 [Tigriopus californicus]|uniref:Peptidase aspartic putative domain-containing protein n=1 Tax=Tigriopus californicus TaxID=6832 RepID=A0A553PTS0_TIGCA|nr:hypothetical protein TCAL_14472 [Tigriopus californicus]
MSGKRKSVLISRIMKKELDHWQSRELDFSSEEEIGEAVAEEVQKASARTPTKPQESSIQGHSGDLLTCFQSMIDQVQKSSERRERELMKKIESMEIKALSRAAAGDSIDSMVMDPVRIKGAFRPHEERIRMAMAKVRKALDAPPNRIIIDTHLASLKKQEERFKTFVEERVDWMEGGELKDQIQIIAREICEECESIDIEARSHLTKLKKKEDEESRAGALAAGFSPPSFNGNPLSFPCFWEAFEAKVHSNPLVSRFYKMQYLIDALKGPAADSLMGMPTTAEHYDDAIQVVRERFGRNRLIFRHINHSILEQEKPGASDFKALRAMRDTFCNRLTAIRSQKVEPTVEMLLMPIMESKLPKEIREEWELKITQEIEKDEFATEKQFLAFLTAKVESKEAAVDMKAGGTDNREDKKREKPMNAGVQRFFSSQTLIAGSEGQAGRCCPCCERNHTILECQKFQDMDVNTRWNEFRTNPRMFNVCLRCLGWRLCPGGHGRFCHKVCSVEVCGRNHHALLHGEVRVEDLRVERTSALMTSPKTLRDAPLLTPSLVQNGRILPTLRAQICVDTHTKEIWVGLDSFAAHSYIRREVVDQLTIPVIDNVSMEVHGFGGKVSKGVAEVVEFTLASVDSIKTQLVVEAVVKSDQICSPLQTVPVNIKQTQRPYFENFSRMTDVPKRPIEVDILLGADYCWKRQEERFEAQANRNEEALAEIKKAQAETLDTRHAAVAAVTGLSAANAGNPTNAVIPETSAVRERFKMPPLWETQPARWICQLENAFDDAHPRITSDMAKYQKFWGLLTERAINECWAVIEADDASLSNPESCCPQSIRSHSRSEA